MLLVLPAADGELLGAREHRREAQAADVQLGGLNVQRCLDLALHVRARHQGLTLVPTSAQLELTWPLSAQLKLTLSPM